MLLTVVLRIPCCCSLLDVRHSFDAWIGRGDRELRR